MSGKRDGCTYTMINDFLFNHLQVGRQLFRFECVQMLLYMFICFYNHERLARPFKIQNKKQELFLLLGCKMEVFRVLERRCCVSGHLMNLSLILTRFKVQCSGFHRLLMEQFGS